VSAEQSGINFLAASAAMTVAAVLSGALVSTFSPYAIHSSREPAFNKIHRRLQLGIMCPRCLPAPSSCPLPLD
jgi:hypothetical protein